MLFMMDISFGAIVLIIFMIPTSIIMHNFWDAPDYQVWMRWYEHVGTIPVFGMMLTVYFAHPAFLHMPRVSACPPCRPSFRFTTRK